MASPQVAHANRRPSCGVEARDSAAGTKGGFRHNAATSGFLVGSQAEG